MSQNFELMHDSAIKFLRLEVECATREYARVAMPLRDACRNGFGIAHGGMVCALADTAFGVAANSGSGHPVVTMSLAIDFLRPGKNGPLVAEARLTHAGNHILNYDVKILDADKQIIASVMVSGYASGAPLPLQYENNQTLPEK